MLSNLTTALRIAEKVTNTSTTTNPHTESMIGALSSCAIVVFAIIAAAIVRYAECACERKRRDSSRSVNLQEVRVNSKRFSLNSALTSSTTSLDIDYGSVSGVSNCE